jgi:hypothetical protein
MRYLLFVFILLTFSCKSKFPQKERKETIEIPVTAVDSSRSPEDYFANKLNFTTAYIKCNAHYETDKQSQHVTAEIKIKKDEKIIISVRFLGITMAKALITPTQVQYYEKLNSNYFDGNFEAISQFAGTDLNFQKLQNVLLGQAIEAFAANEYTLAKEDKWVKLQKDNASALITYFFDANNRLLQKQIIQQQVQERLLTVSYPKFSSYQEVIFPSNILLNAEQKQTKMNLNIEYTDVSLNEELSFPYAVPTGYKRIVIN